jgi:hypothetical protein
MAKSKAKKVKTKYFGKGVLLEMNEARIEIYAYRKLIWDKFKIDLLVNDTMSGLQLHEIVSNYDPDFNINLARNGEDGCSNGVSIEQKTNDIDKDKNDASFAFHALGDILHDRYILVVRKKDDLKIIRLFDISEPKNVQIVQKELQRLSDDWRAKGPRKYDIIRLTEVFLRQNLKFNDTVMIGDCAIIKDTLNTSL